MASDNRKKLPPPAQSRPGEMSLREALLLRRSIRRYSPREIPDTILSELLWAAQGITIPSTPFRTAPSAGSLYPLRLSIVRSLGGYRYLPETHSITRTLSGDVRSQLSHCALNQEYIQQAPLSIIIAGDLAAIRKRFPGNAKRFLHCEAGHVAQNISLQAAAFGLGTVPLGTFNNPELSKLLQLEKEVTPVYIIPSGYPEESENL
jgi:SagB-type dehydrogenase family enzyme